MSLMWQEDGVAPGLLLVSPASCPVVPEMCFGADKSDRRLEVLGDFGPNDDDTETLSSRKIGDGDQNLWLRHRKLSPLCVTGGPGLVLGTDFF